MTTYGPGDWIVFWLAAVCLGFPILYMVIAP
jgi:hypothetical protein